MFILGQQIVDGEPNGPVGDREEQGNCREHPVVELPLTENIFRIFFVNFETGHCLVIEPYPFFTNVKVKGDPLSIS